LVTVCYYVLRHNAGIRLIHLDSCTTPNNFIRNNGVIREYVWGLNIGGGIGGLLNLKQGEQNYSYLYDGKGNVTALLNNSQGVVATYTYDTFGNLMAKTGSINQPIGMSTKSYDEKTGLSYYGYRFYSSSLGRWITRDPIYESGGRSLYEYVRNNPINWIDLFGLQELYCEDREEVANAFKKWQEGGGTEEEYENARKKLERKVGRVDILTSFFAMIWEYIDLPFNLKPPSNLGDAPEEALEEGTYRLKEGSETQQRPIEREQNLETPEAR